MADLESIFLEWILQLEIPEEAIYNLAPDAAFLNFNYTKTLEEACGVPDARILYIHNGAIDESSNLILGHGREFTEEFSLSAQVGEDTDPRVADGFSLLERYFKDSYKNTGNIFRNNEWSGILGSMSVES